MIKNSFHGISRFSGESILEGDKSISHRALILTSQAVGSSKIYGLLESSDVLNTLKALQQLGVVISKKIDSNGEKYYEVLGQSIGNLSESSNFLDCGNAGTGVRLLMGLVASNLIKSFFTGDDSLRNRPMKRIIIPLLLMGCNVSARQDSKLPLLIEGSEDLLAIEYKLPVPSAQLKSSILLAALNISGETIIEEPALSRDHTEIMLEYLGAKLTYLPAEASSGSSGRIIKFMGKQILTARDIIVPKDPSSAAFIIAAVMLTENSNVLIKDICINPGRIGFLTILKKMGANIIYENKRIICGEHVADIRVRSSKLEAITIEKDEVVAMIDEYPILAVIVSFATGKTIMHGLEELKVKESNRLSAIAENLGNLGINIVLDEENSSLEITGNSNKNIQLSADYVVRTYNDHRIAMAFLIMGLKCNKVITVDSVESIKTSFPSFFEKIFELVA